MLGRFLVAAIYIAGCSSTSRGPAPSSDGPAPSSNDAGAACSAGCESNIWPRIIVGIAPPKGFLGDEAHLANVSGDFGGVIYQAAPHQCPELPETLRCSYALFSTPEDKTFELIVALAGGQEVRKQVTLGPFNTCGRSITYITVVVDSDSATLSEPRYVSPCAAL